MYSEINITKDLLRKYKIKNVSYLNIKHKSAHLNIIDLKLLNDFYYTKYQQYNKGHHYNM